jgi:hypothetical protein
MSLVLSGTNGLSDVDGTAATPAIRGTDANTGIFFPAADTIGFAEGGAEVARFNADAQFVAAAGTASLPVITTTGDVNTGIFFPAADTIAFSEGGVESMRIDSSGSVGIGTSSPTEKITVNGGVAVKGAYSGTSNGGAVNITYNTGTSTGAIYALDPTVAWKTLDISSLTTTFGISGSERMRIDSSGSFRTYAANPIITGTSNAADATTANAIFQGRYSATSTTGGGTNCIFITSNGNIYNTNAIYGTLSDAKLKENIVDATSQWNDIKALRVRNFNFKEGQTHTQIGYIAQEVEAVSPSLVDTSQDVDAEGNELGTTTKSLKLSVINIKAVKALQENMVRTESLETLIQEQQALITTLTDRITALEAK